MIRHLLGILLAILATSVMAVAETEPFAPPTVADIRALYEAESAAWQSAPKQIVDAFIVAEDKNFYLRRVSRSTITQLVARRFMPLGTRGITAFAFTALVANALSHDEIVDWYVHTVELGLGCRGIDNAAMAYFGKSPQDLAVGEYAYLAALPIGPYDLHPIDDYEDAMKRRNYVLTQMFKAGALTEERAKQLQASALAVREPLGTCKPD